MENAEAALNLGLVRRGWSPTGGAEAYLQRLVQALSAQSHQLTLYASEWPESQWQAGELVRLAGGTPLQFSRNFHAQRKRHDLVFSMERVPGCDVYRAGDGVHAAWLERRKQMEPAWKDWFRRLQPKHRELLELEREVFHPDKTGRIIANSKLVAGEIVRFFNFPAEKIRVVYNGCPPQPPAMAEEDRQKLHREWEIPSGSMVVLFVGTGWHRKGLRQAIETTQGNDQILLVAGSGPERKFRAPHVRHLGGRGDIPKVLGAADVLLHPTWYDPFSNACLEALAAGLPVITTRDNGVCEILEEGKTGSVVDRADDCSGLAEALSFWKEQDRVATQKQCQAAAEKFSMERNTSETLQVFHELLLEKT